MFHNVSSLPQGWHGTGPCKTSASSTSGIARSSVPVTVRKKWNSPLSSNVPQTKLPSYKSSNLRQQNHKLNSTYQLQTPVTASPTTQTKLPTSTKPSPVKEYKDEITKLKKELSIIRAENSILKAKVRRVDDENLQKGRQIEKMRAEIKALQKNESANSRRSKESHELLSLRQKCLRLESVLKDKDLVIKKLTSESSLKKEEAEKRKSLTQIYQVNSVAQLKQASKSSEKDSLSAKSNLSRTSHTLKTEVTKLRDMIHKLEKENQDLQQQAKLHCQEIRRLKIQLKSKVTAPITSGAKLTTSEAVKIVKNKSEAVESKNQTDVQSKINAHNLFVPKQKADKKIKSVSHSVGIPKPSQISQTASQKSSLQKSIPVIRKASSIPNGNVKKISPNKLIKNVQSKLPVTKSSLVKSIPKSASDKIAVQESANKSCDEKTDLELKIQEMRENIAAKKIQKSWREHKRNLQHSTDFELQGETKALNFIVSSMKHHKLRKDKLHTLVKRKSYFPQNINREEFKGAIESVAKKVWDQDFNVS